MAIIELEDLVGIHFNLPTSDGELKDAETEEVTLDLDHTDGVNDDSTLTKFCYRLNNNDTHQETIECDQVIDHIENSNDQPVFWELMHMVAHQGPLPSTHPAHNGSPCNVTVEWENGETTDELLAAIALDALVTCAM